MVKVWCDSEDAAATGKTQGTFDDIGTISLKVGAKEVLGIIVLAGTSTPTSGENGAPVLQIDSDDLDISKQQVQLSGAVTDGIATNDKEAPVVAQFIPWKLKSGVASLDNAEVTFAVSSTTTTTGGWDIAVGMVVADGPPDAQFMLELLSGNVGRAIGGQVAYFRAGVKAATPTSFTTGPKVTSRGNELIGLCGYANPNAPTAGEAVIGITEFQASQIPDFSPQKWPMIVGWGAGIGTPVGTPVTANLRGGVYWPTRFTLPKKNFTMAVSMLFATALTNEADGIAGLLWR